MGYAGIARRGLQLRAEANQLNQQIQNITDMMKINNNRTNNLQRLISQEQNIQQANEGWAQAQGINNIDYSAAVTGCGNGSGATGTSGCSTGNAGNTGSYTSSNLDGDWLKYYWPYAQSAMIDSDLELQKKQLETRLQVVTKEIEAADKGEEAAIGRTTAKYA